jgi:hypothetical protein
MPATQIPSILFKYRGTDKIFRTLEIFEGKLYFSKIEQFNDGFEYFYTFTEEVIIKNNQNQRETLSPQQQIKRFEPIIKSLTIEKGHYCLCGNETNLSMWALYADGHKGVCIGFDWSKLKEAGPWNFPEEINYISTPVVVDKHSRGAWDAWGKVFTSKHEDFAFENEWRLSLDKHGYIDEGKKEIIKSSISQVVFGFRSTIDFQRKVIMKCMVEGINTEFFITQCIPGEYKLELSKLNVEELICDSIEVI